VLVFSAYAEAMEQSEIVSVKHETRLMIDAFSLVAPLGTMNRRTFGTLMAHLRPHFAFDKVDLYWDVLCQIQHPSDVTAIDMLVPHTAADNSSSNNNNNNNNSNNNSNNKGSSQAGNGRSIRNTSSTVFADNTPLVNVNNPASGEECDNDTSFERMQVNSGDDATAAATVSSADLLNPYSFMFLLSLLRKRIQLVSTDPSQRVVTQQRGGSKSSSGGGSSWRNSNACHALVRALRSSSYDLAMDWLALIVAIIIIIIVMSVDPTRNADTLTRRIPGLEYAVWPAVAALLLSVAVEIFILGPVAFFGGGVKKQLDVLLIVGIIFTFATGVGSAGVVGSLLVFRSLRCVRVFGFVPRILEVVGISAKLIPALASVIVVELLVIYAYAVVGQALFYIPKHSIAVPGGGGDVNMFVDAKIRALERLDVSGRACDFFSEHLELYDWDGMLRSMLTLFIVTLGADWHLVTCGYGLLRSTLLAQAFFGSFFLISNLLIGTVLIAYFLEAFTAMWRAQRDGTSLTADDWFDARIAEIPVSANDSSSSAAGRGSPPPGGTAATAPPQARRVWRATPKLTSRFFIRTVFGPRDRTDWNPTGMPRLPKVQRVVLNTKCFNDFVANMRDLVEL
jgi:uncharacterized integral membrane protein